MYKMKIIKLNKRAGWGHQSQDVTDGAVSGCTEQLLYLRPAAA